MKARRSTRSQALRGQRARSRLRSRSMARSSTHAGPAVMDCRRSTSPPSRGSWRPRAGEGRQAWESRRFVAVRFRGRARAARREDRPRTRRRCALHRPGPIGVSLRPCSIRVSLCRRAAGARLGRAHVLQCHRASMAIPRAPKYQALGVADGNLAGKMADVLARLGVERAIVFHAGEAWTSCQSAGRRS